LASAAGLAIVGASSDAIAQNATYTVSTTVAVQTTPLFQLINSDTLIATPTGVLTIGSTATGYQPVVDANALGVAFIQNAGTIQSQQTTGGIAIGVQTLTSIGTINNQTGGLIQTTSTSGDSAVNIAGGLLSLINSGTILSTGQAGAGVQVVSGGSVGTLTNNLGATISATGSQGVGVQVTGGSIASVINNGSILATNTGGTALAVGAPGFGGTVGTITNGTTGTIMATGTNGVGVDVQTALSNLTNQGQILSTGTGGTAVNIGGTAIVGGVTNTTTGTINAGAGNGTAVNIAGALQQLVNQGTVLANGISGTGVNVVSGAQVGTISNTAGTIQANGSSGAGVVIGGTVGALNNTGQIQANGTNGVGVSVGGTVTTVNNAGSITANGPGGTAVAVTSGGFMQGLTNAATGQIQANGSNGVAVNIATNGAVNNIQNAGTVIASDPTGTGINVAGNLGTVNNTGLVQGGPANGTGTAINLTNDQSTTTINSSGSIVGGISLSAANPDTVNLTGGSLNGGINGNFGFNTVNLSGGTIVAGNTVAGLFVLNVNSGVQNVGAGGITITGGFAVNVASGATLAVNGGTIGLSSGPAINGQPSGLNNSGLVNIGSAAVALTGNFNNAPGSQLGITVNPTSAGQINVTGTANVSSTQIALHFTSLTGPTSFVAVTATGGVNAAPLPPVSSDSLNPYFDFPIDSLTNPNTLIISFPTPTVNQLNGLFCTLFCGDTGGLTSTGGTNQADTIGGVGQLADALLASGNAPALTNLFVTLRSLTPAQQVLFFQQVQPSQIGTALAQLAQELANNGGLTTSVDDHVYGMRNNVTGMGGGDEVGRGLTVWAKPYGETFTQNRKEAVNGYTASVYGLAAGADMLIRRDVRVGAAASLSNANINFAGSQSGNTGSDLLFQTGLYGSYFSNNFFLDGVGAFGLHWLNTKESISAFGLQRTSSYNGVQFEGRVTAGYDWHAGPATVVTPSVTFQEIHIDTDANQTQGGGIFNLNVAPQHIDVTQLKFGSRAAYTITQPNGWVFTPEVHAYYIRNLVLTRVANSAAFTSGGSMTVYGAQRDADLADLGLGMTIAQKGPFTLSAVYDYTFGQTQSDNKFFLRVKTEF
jgi:outer membrane autotransporter protein